MQGIPVQQLRERVEQILINRGFTLEPQFGKAIHPIVPHCPTRRRQAGSRSINLRRP